MIIEFVVYTLIVFRMSVQLLTNRCKLLIGLNMFVALSCPLANSMHAYS